MIVAHSTNAQCQVGQRNPDTAYQNPDHVEERRQSGTRVVIRLYLFAEGNQTSPRQLKRPEYPAECQ